MADLFGDDASERKRALATDILWTHGVRLLIAGGMKEQHARAFLAKRVKELSAEIIARGIVAAIFNGVVDPRSYLGAISPRPAAARGEVENSEPPQRTDGLQPWMKD